jgi:hypothetical protein
MRFWRLLLPLAGLALVAAGTFVLWPRTDRITRKNFDRIEKGMSRVQVESILGPPGDYRTGPGAIDWIPEFGPVTGNTIWGEGRCWWADTLLIVVAFDESGSAYRYWCFDEKRSQQSPLENFLWRAKRLWRRWFA